MSDIKLPCEMESWDGRVVDANDMYVDTDEVLLRVNYHDRLREALRELLAVLENVEHWSNYPKEARALLDELDNMDPKP